MKLKGFYRTLLGPYSDHPLLGRYLTSAVPDFAGIYEDIYPSLSGGEQVLVDISIALYNGDSRAKISDLFLLDVKSRTLALDAINERMTSG